MGFNVLLGAIERLEAELNCANAEVVSLSDEVERWKLASGLERGGDPDGVTPEAAQSYWNEVESEVYGIGRVVEELTKVR